VIRSVIRLPPAAARSHARHWRRPRALALPWLFTTMPLRPRNTAPLWLFGIEMMRSRSVAGREIRKPILERSELVKAALAAGRRRSGPCLRPPSARYCRKSRRSRHVELAAASLSASVKPSKDIASCRARAQIAAASRSSSVPLISSVPMLSSRTRGAVKAGDDAGIGRAHDRELHEVARVALGVGAKIEHHQIVVAQRRQQRGQRGPVDPRHGAQRQLGDRHQRAGIAAADGCPGLAGLSRRRSPGPSRWSSRGAAPGSASRRR
jgi:hypothetical protein